MVVGRIRRGVRKIIDRVYKRPPREAFERVDHPNARIMSHSAELLEKLSREARNGRFNDEELRRISSEFLRTRISRKEAESILASLSDREISQLIIYLHRLRKQYEGISDQAKSVVRTAQISQEILLDFLKAKNERELDEKVRALEGAQEAMRLKESITKASYEEWLETAKNFMQFYLELLRKGRR